MMDNKTDHQAIYENIRQATSAKAKADFLADLIFKVVMNDINHVEEKIEKVDDKVNKITIKVAWIVGVISALTVGANIAIRLL